MPGKRSSRWFEISSSSGRNRTVSPSLGSSTNRGSIGGTLSRANSWRPVRALRMRIARLSERPEMYGNGCAGSTASGISTGKTCAWK